MARKRLPPDDPREWLNRARSNLVLARKIAPDVYLEDLCFDAQQAAEKAIKAVSIHRGVTFPYVHDLTRLLRVLEQSGLKIPKYVRQAEELSRFAVEMRYPGLAGPVTKRQHRRAVRIAEGRPALGRTADWKAMIPEEPMMPRKSPAHDSRVITYRTLPGPAPQYQRVNVGECTAWVQTNLARSIWRYKAPTKRPRPGRTPSTRSVSTTERSSRPCT